MEYLELVPRVLICSVSFMCLCFGIAAIITAIAKRTESYMSMIIAEEHLRRDNDTEPENS